MQYTKQNRKYQLSERQKRLLELSVTEVASLNERELRCPQCGYLIEYLFADAAGHKRIKCQKCKFASVINLGYFRRVKQTQSE